MGEIGKSQYTKDQRDPQSPQRQLRPIGQGRDEYIIRHQGEHVQDFHRPYPPRKDLRTSGSAINASPVSVKRFSPDTRT